MSKNCLRNDAILYIRNISLLSIGEDITRIVQISVVYLIPTLGLLKGRYSIPRIISNSMMTILYFESQEERTRVKVHRVMEDDNITIYIVSWLIGNCFAVTPRREHYKRVHVKRRNGSCQKLSEFAAKSLCIHATRFFSSFFSLVPEFVTENLERRRLERNPFIDFLFSSSSLRVIL